MSGFLLDTDVLSQLLRPRPPASLRRRLSVVPAARIHASVMTVMELRTGCRRKTSGGLDLWRRVRDEVLSGLKIVPLLPRHAVLAGDLRALLDAHGEPIGLVDTLIAATALSEDLVLVTGNARHYRRVPRLRWENWLEG